MGRSIKSKQRTALILATVAVCLVIALTLRHRVSDASRAEEENHRPIKVATMQLAALPIADETSASGTVRPMQEAQLAPKIMSTVSAIYVKEGDRVRQGQVLIRLEARDLSAQAASAGAAVRSAQAMYEKASTAVELQATETSTGIANASAALEMARQHLSAVKEGPRRQERAQADLAVVQAEAQYRNAETELARMTRLYQEDVIPKQRLDATQMQFEVAKAQLGIARQQAEMSREGGRSQDVLAAQERVRQAEEGLRLAKAAAVRNRMARREAQASASMVSQARAGAASAGVQLGYATIVAPFSGVVAARFVDKGDTVTPGVPVIAIQDDSLFRLETMVAAKDVRAFQKGMSVSMELGSAKRTGVGRVSVISPAGDPATRKFLVKVDIPKSLFPVAGDFGRMSFARGFTTGIVVPQSAIHDEGGVLNVYAVGPNNRADMRIVRTGRTTRLGVEVTAGLKPGDEVVIASSAPLSDDMPIAVEGR